MTREKDFRQVDTCVQLLTAVFAVWLAGNRAGVKAGTAGRRTAQNPRTYALHAIELAAPC